MPSLPANLVLPKFSKGEKQIEKNTSLETLPIQLIRVGVNVLILKNIGHTLTAIYYSFVWSQYTPVAVSLYVHAAIRIWINLAVYSCTDYDVFGFLGPEQREL